jgi:hypothetical protein
MFLSLVVVVRTTTTMMPKKRKKEIIDPDDSVVRDPSSPVQIDIETDVRPLLWAWAALAHVDNISGAGVKGLLGLLPPKFQRLACYAGEESDFDAVES